MRGKAQRIAFSAPQCRPLVNTNETHLLIAILARSPPPTERTWSHPQQNLRRQLYNVLCLELLGNWTETHKISTRCTEM